VALYLVLTIAFVAFGYFGVKVLTHYFRKWLVKHRH
jgi:hypothetical protein